MALQGGAELRKFGALSLIINLVGVSMTRELGPLMAAIVVIGRSGSSFSAEIGTMVVTEEVDALRSMALSPLEFLLVPKYLAMLVMMPCLTIAADFAGILAGGIFAYYTLDMGLGLYLRATLEILFLRDIVSGLIKSIAFGTIIVHVGCFEGFHVTGVPEGVGAATTSAVVKSIFLVILADLLFTAFFYFFWP
jgi:phospholipid/cholesterol/gamma-HCH transport system permease protein